MARHPCWCVMNLCQETYRRGTPALFVTSRYDPCLSWWPQIWRLAFRDLWENPRLSEWPLKQPLPLLKCDGIKEAQDCIVRSMVLAGTWHGTRLLLFYSRWKKEERYITWATLMEVKKNKKKKTQGYRSIRIRVVSCGQRCGLEHDMELASYYFINTKKKKIDGSSSPPWWR